MADFGNLTKLLDSSGGDYDGETPSTEVSDDVGPEDSRDQVFNSAAQEAFHALKGDDAQGFAEALKTALEAL